MTSDRTILITGVTGNQGGAVAQALQGKGFHLRGLTRKPDGERAAALASSGVEGFMGSRPVAGNGETQVTRQDRASCGLEARLSWVTPATATSSGVSSWRNVTIWIWRQRDGSPAASPGSRAAWS
jgi:NAD(P)-dependent dehydrogenase (short-subunit alcohol dehydrogenase family)